MPHSHLHSLTTDLLARAQRVRLACFDVDGTLTNGGLLLDANGREGKIFHARDGLGLVLLRRAGIQVALVTARKGPVVEHRGAELGIAVHQGVQDKLSCTQALCQAAGHTLDAALFMGDDLPDLSVLRQAGLAVAPADAHPWVASAVHWQTHANGGHGAAREACDLVLAAQGKVAALLEGGAR